MIYVTLQREEGDLGKCDSLGLCCSAALRGVNLVRSLGVVNLVAEILDSTRKKFPIFQAKILTTLF